MVHSYINPPEQQAAVTDKFMEKLLAQIETDVSLGNQWSGYCIYICQVVSYMTHNVAS